MNYPRKKPSIWPMVFSLGSFIILIGIWVSLLGGARITIEAGKPVWHWQSDPKNSGKLREVERFKQSAIKLKQHGFIGAALKDFERYIEQIASSKPTPEIGNILYALGESFFEQKKYTKALALFIRAEFFIAKSDVLYKKNILKQMNCLERLGKTKAANFLLEEHSSKKTPTGSSFKTPLLRLGKTILTEKDFNQFLKQGLGKNPKTMSKEEKKQAFQQWIFSEILNRKALRLGLQEDPELTRKAKFFKRQLMEDALLKSELEALPEPDESTLQAFFKDRPERFKSMDTREWTSIKNKVKQVYQNESKQKRIQHYFKTLIKEEEVEIFETNLS